MNTDIIRYRAKIAIWLGWRDSGLALRERGNILSNIKMQLVEKVIVLMMLI